MDFYFMMTEWRDAEACGNMLLGDDTPESRRRESATTHSDRSRCTFRLKIPGQTAEEPV